MSKTNPWIAIVDDDESVCRALKRLLRSLGVNANTFTSGREFLAFLETEPIPEVDCVVLDVQMPGLTGLEVHEHLIRARCDFPVIFITAQDNLEIHEDALGAGVVALLRKPFDDELLIRKLREALHSDSEDSNTAESSKRPGPKLLKEG